MGTTITGVKSTRGVGRGIIGGPGGGVVSTTGGGVTGGGGVVITGGPSMIISSWHNARGLETRKIKLTKAGTTFMYDFMAVKYITGPPYSDLLLQDPLNTPSG